MVALISAVCVAWVYHKRQKARRRVAIPLEKAETAARKDEWTKPEIDSNIRCELPNRQRALPELSELAVQRGELATDYQGTELRIRADEE